MTLNAPKGRSSTARSSKLDQPSGKKPGAATLPRPMETLLPGVLIDPYLPQPGQHVGRRLIKIEDTPDEFWLDGATLVGVPWPVELGVELDDAGIWDIRKPERLTSAWFHARARIRPQRLATPLRRMAVAMNSEAQEIQATTGSLRNWAQGRSR
jgi:hypothetical protein